MLQLFKDFLPTREDSIINDNFHGFALKYQMVRVAIFECSVFALTRTAAAGSLATRSRRRTFLLYAHLKLVFLDASKYIVQERIDIARTSNRDFLLVEVNFAINV